MIEKRVHSAADGHYRKIQFVIVAKELSGAGSHTGTMRCRPSVHWC